MILGKFYQLILAWFRLPSWKQIFSALILGVIAGALLHKHTAFLKPIGALFINAIHMIVAPVVFTAIVTSIISVKENSNVRRITLKSIGLYAVCMLVSATLGCFLAYLIAPGEGYHALTSKVAVTNLGETSFASFIQNLVPSNPINPFLNNNVLQLIIFALLFGGAIKLAGKPAEPVARFFVALNKVIHQLTSLVISFAPYGIFALIALVVGTFGFDVLTPLLVFVGTVYAGCAVLFLVVYPVGLLLFTEIKPLKFYRAIMPSLLLAYTSSSSAATLPVTMRCAEEQLKIPSHIARFLLPLGASFNLNGLSVYLSAAAVFAANLNGIHLGIAQYLTIVVTITFTAMGAAAIPGSALVVMGAVMSAVNIPLNAMALITGVDRLNDMMQTTTNVAGDVFVSAVVAKQELAQLTPSFPDATPSLD